MPIYLNYGEEDFLRNFNSEKIIKNTPLQNLSMNLINLSEDNISKLIENCEQMPFFDEYKIIYVKNSGLFSSGNKKASSEIQDKIAIYIEKLPEYIILIFNEENVDKRLSIYKRLSKIATCNEYKYQNEVDLMTWTIRGMGKLGAEINKDVAMYLVNVCGPSMTYLYTEIEKLAILYKEGEKITERLVDSICMKSEQGIIFDLTDCIGNKNTKKAIKLIDDLVLQKQAEQYILIMLYKHVRNMFLVKLCTSDGESVDRLGLNPYVCRKVQTQVKVFNLQEIRNMLNYLIELDSKSKNGEIDIRVGLDVFVANLD